MTLFYPLLIATALSAPFFAAFCLRLHAALRRARTDLAGIREDLIARMREVEKYRLCAEHANDGLVIQTLDGVIIWANPAYCRIMGRPAEAVLGRNPLEFALVPEDTPSPAEIAAFRYDPDDPQWRELHLFRNRRGDGAEFWNQISISFRRAPSGESHAILVCRDVTDQIEDAERLRRIRKQLEHAATHDDLTGTANRTELARFTADALTAARSKGRHLGLLHVDLDKFKTINDTHGHAAGDACLVHAARALSTGVRDGDMVARVGGDEFVVACCDLARPDDLELIATGLLSALAAPLSWGGRRLTVQASIGAALSDDRAGSDELLLRSDFALYEAKRKGRNQVRVYDHGLHRQRSTGNRRSGLLADAIRRKTIEFQFQPIVDLADHRLRGVETLVRWSHPEDGPVPPADVIRNARDLGLMTELDHCAMEAALGLCADLSKMDDRAYVSFNASGALLTNRAFPAHLARQARQLDLDPSRIALEVLETTALAAPNSPSPQMRGIAELRDTGFRVLLDDFGMGHAGLGHLARLTVSGLKIDRSLVARLPQDRVSLKIVGAIVALCRDLGIETIAEGVEDADTAAALAELGTMAIQGFWIAPALPRDALLDWIAARSSPPPTVRIARH